MSAVERNDDGFALTRMPDLPASGGTPAQDRLPRRSRLRVGLGARLGTRLRERLASRWPSIRRQLPRDLSIVLFLAVLAQHLGLAWVMTDSVHTSLALVLKGASVRPGQLAVFGYTGETIPRYNEDWADGLRRRLGLEVAPQDGPRRGDGFTKYLIGIPGDRIEVEEGGRVFLVTAQGRFDMGRCKPFSRHGVPLQCTQAQVIPEGYVYMWAPHVDALDSRYAVMGLVPRSSIVGRAVKLW